MELTAADIGPLIGLILVWGFFLVVALAQLAAWILIIVRVIAQAWERLK